MTEAEQREAVLREAMSWLGTPFHHQGRIKGVGADCGQFPLAVFEACGMIPNYIPEDYPRDFHLHSDQEMYLHHMEKFAVQVSEPKPGDIAVFRFGRVISHGSIVIHWPEIIHAYVEADCVTLDNAEQNAALAKRFVGWWSIFEKGLA